MGEGRPNPVQIYEIVIDEYQRGLIQRALTLDRQLHPLDYTPRPEGVAAAPGEYIVEMFTSLPELEKTDPGSVHGFAL